jgi:transcription elongation factor SPT6
VGRGAEREDEEEETEWVTEVRVLAIVHGGTTRESEPTVAVMVNPTGGVIDFVQLPNIAERGRSVVAEARREADQDRLRRFMEEHSPHVCVLGASSVECHYIKEHVLQTVFKIMEDNPRAIPDGVDTIHTVYADPAVPTLWENTSGQELKDYSCNVRKAVGLARYLQDPLMLWAATFENRAVLSLNIHPLQNHLGEEERYAMLERMMVTAVNQVSVDLTAAMMSEWKQATLQFVAGLGPRKARALLRSLTQAGAVESRQTVEMDLGPVVFTNCAAFIRVQPFGHNEDYDPLDATRIHPESYSFPRQMALDALELEGTSDDAKRLAVERAMEEWHHVDELDLEVYASELEKRGEGLKLSTLQDIKRELRQPAEEVRRTYTEPTAAEQFILLTHETPDTLKEGKILQVRVTSVQPTKVCVALDTGLRGVINKEDLSDRAGETGFRLSSKVSQGMIVTARVLQGGIRDSGMPSEYSCDLACAGMQFKPNAYEFWEKFYNTDPYYAIPDISKEARPAAKASSRKKSFIARNIKHPSFKNVDMAESTKLLEQVSKE